MRRFVVLLLVAAAIFWIVREQPTVSGFVDRITRPLFGSKAVVDESEHNRVVNESAPVVSGNEEKRVAALKEGMNVRDVRELFGDPDSIRDVVQDGHPRERWEYRRFRRILYIENYRVVSIVVL